MSYAVDPMVVLRCTQQLLVRMKQFDDRTGARSSDAPRRLVRQHPPNGTTSRAILISERSRLPVLIPIREAYRLPSVFPEAVCQMLAAVGVSAADIEEERSRMSEIAYERTKSRSLLGTLNDMSFGARVHFITGRNESLEAIARDLARTPILPLDGASPIGLTRAAFGNGVTR